MNYPDIAKLRTLLPGMVLLPIPRKKKRPVFNDWEAVTLEQSTNPDFRITYSWKDKVCRTQRQRDATYSEELKRGNVGVLLGAPSGGLCAIDIDVPDHAALEEFLNLNPKLRGTLITRRVNAGTVWVRVAGQWPPTHRTLMRGAERWGEWRSDGAQCVVWGSAMDQNKGETKATEYRFLNEATPLVVAFEEIVWPPGVEQPKLSPPRERSSSISLNAISCNPVDSVSTVSSVYTSIVANIDAREKALEMFTKVHPGLAKYYEDVLEPRLMALPGQRNQRITTAVPFLFRAVSEAVLVDVMITFYYANKALFNDSPETHDKEVRAMAAAVANTYVEELMEGERIVYSKLKNEFQMATFRILRDLAVNNKTTPGRMHMGMCHLAARLKCTPKTAERALKRLHSYGIIDVATKGLPYAPGQPHLATEYQWLLPLPIRQTVPHAEAQPIAA